MAWIAAADLSPLELGPHDRPSAAHARPDGDRPERTIHHAGAAFHAPVPVREPGPLSVHHEDRMGADDSAQAAARALLRVVSERDHVLEILERRRLSPLLQRMKKPAAVATTPRAAERIINGTAIFISRTTPDSDVKVLDPVKFMARKEDTAGSKRA